MRYQVIQNKAFLYISGADAWVFLQNLLTNDVLKDGPSYGMLLNPQGRYLSDFFVINYLEGYLLEMPMANKDKILMKLNLYKLKSSVNIKEIQDFNVIYSEDFIENSILCYKDPRGEFGFRSISQDFDKECETDVYNEIKYSVPIIDGEDMRYEKSIPIEYGMEKFNAISFTKGCYIGQEVISRAKNLGEIRKKVMVVSNAELDGITNKYIICSSWGDKSIILMSEALV